MYDNETACVVLAGGQGARLKSLTKDRAKPAVYFAGKYRFIDFVLANFINSGLRRRIFVVTQYAPQSLYQHIEKFWIPLCGFGESIMLTPPKMRSEEELRYMGTADAIWQNWKMLADKRFGAKRVAIFSGDHVYQMNITQVIDFHSAKGSGFTICVERVTVATAAGELGVLKVDADNRVIDFVEKPPFGEVPEIPGDPGYCLASMGNYIACTEVLGPILAEDAADVSSKHDFGKNVIPMMLARGLPLYAYPFHQNVIEGMEGHYWRDVGTLRAYYEASMETLEYVPKLNLDNPLWPIPTFPDNLASARFLGNDVKVQFTSASGGVVVDDAFVSWSVLGRRVMVKKGAGVENSILFGDVEVGHGVRLQRVICDKRVVIPSNKQIGFDKASDDSYGFHIEDLGNGQWLTVIPKDYQFKK